MFTRHQPQPAAAPRDRGVRCALVAAFLGTSLTLAVPAIAQTATDTALALRSQILGAYNAGLSSVTIAPGTYEVANTGNTILNFNGLSNFTIHADGVRLVAKELKQVVNFSNAQNLTVNGLSVDYDPLPFTQGRVVSKNGNNSSFVVELHDGYAAYTGSTRAILYEPDTFRVKPGSNTRYGFNVAPAQLPNRVTVTGQAISDNLAIGDLITLTRDNDIQIPHAVRLTDSTGVVMNNLTVHASTSFGLFETGGGNNVFNGYTVTPGQAPGTNGPARLLSANADGFHSKHTAVGPQVNQATIRAQGDDGVAINGSYLPIGQNNAGGNTLTVASRATNIQDHLRVGDTLRIHDAAAGTTVDATVTAIAAESATDWAAVRSQYYPDLNTGSTSYNRGYTLTLDRNVSVNPGDFVANPDRNAAGFAITNSTIENHRARGILVKASDGEIRDNVVDGSSLAGIVLSAEPLLWLESDFSNNVQIVGNTIRNTGYAFENANTTKAGAISITGPVEWNGLGHANIVLDGNIIQDATGANLVLSTAQGVAIRNNRFINPNQSASSTGQATGVDANAVIWVGDAAGVNFTGNTVTNPGTANSALIRITGETGTTTNRFGGVVQAHDDNVETIANYRDDFNAPSPAAGWSYLWNANGDIGDPDHYAALQAAANGEYTSDGTAIPNADPAASLRLGSNFAHPGFGSQQSDRDYFAIAAYTVQADGEYFIRDSLIQTNANTTGIDVFIHVNDDPALFEDTITNLAVASFDAALGQLIAGDTIFVAIGPSGSSGFDFVNFDFSIASTFSLTIAGDFNGSGSVEQGDLDMVLNGWGTSNFASAAGAIPGGGPFDGLVDQNELDAVLNHWGNASQLANLTSLPEPAAAVVLVMAGFALSERRR